MSQFIVQSPNTPPVANAGNNLVVKSGSQVELNGSGSYDPNPEGEIVSYLWERIDEGSSGNPYVTLSDPNIINPTFIADNLNPGAKSITHRFKLTVTDDRGDTDEDIIVVIVESANAPPTAVARIALRNRINARTKMPFTARRNMATVDSGSTVELDGTLSYDIEEQNLTYLWERIGGSGDSNVVLSRS